MSTAPPVQWVRDDAALDAAVSAWATARILFMDTEFERTRTYFPRPALVQVYDGDTVSLVDPLASLDASRLGPVLADASVVKVFHACQEDMEVLARLTGVVPTGVFDTQLAAAFLGLGFSLGFNRLLTTLTGTERPDDSAITRSDWLQRPLTPTQEAYAVSDVVDLATAYRELVPSLSDERRGWVEAETAERVRQAAFLPPVDSAWERLGSSVAALPAEAQQRAFALAAWRERTAREDDVARNRILRDAALLSLAAEPVDRVAALKKRADLHPAAVRHYGEAIVTQLAAGPDWPGPQRPAPGREARAVRAALKAATAEVARQTGVPAPLLASKRSLEAVLQAWWYHEPLPAWLTDGWRRSLLLAPLTQCLESCADERPAV